MPILLRNLIIVLLATVLSMPLLWICLTGGDKSFDEKSSSEIYFSLISLAPILSVLAAAAFKKLQITMLIILTIIVTIEITEGIVPTSQLNHEGSDLVFLFLHLMHLVISIIAIFILYTIRMLKKHKTPNSIHKHHHFDF